MLVWLAPFETQRFAWRRFVRRADAVSHLAIATIVVAFLLFSIYGLLLQSPWESSLWLLPFSGRWEVVLLTIAFFLGTFGAYRMRTRQENAVPLPSWEPDTAKRNIKVASTAQTTRDVSQHLTPTAWEILEQAYDSALRLTHTEIRPVHFFVSGLASVSGGIFLTRLGVSFDQVREGLAELLRAIPTGTPTVLSLDARKVLLEAYEDARQADRRAIGPVEIFLAAFRADEAIQIVFDKAGFPANQVMEVAEWIRTQESLKEQQDRFVRLAALKPKSVMNRSMTARQTPLLDQLSEDLTMMARNGYIAPVVGRVQEMEALLRAIEGGGRSIVLVGDPGVGKTALVEALARRMVVEDVPDLLFDKRLVSVHLSQLLSAGEPALAPQRLQALIGEAVASGNIILVLEGIEALVGTGIGSMELSELLAAELRRGGLFVIGTTTPSAWTGQLERRSLGSTLLRISVNEPEPADALKMLLVRTGYVEYRHGVFFTYASLALAVRLAGTLIHATALPESALTVLEEAAALVRKERGDGSLVSAEDVSRIMQEKTGIPTEAVTKDESDKLLGLEDKLHTRVIGQQEAVVAVAQAMRRARAQVREGKRPIANFLFLGPTGVGKTELAKALAAEYFGDEKLMIRLDMSEYQSPDSVDRMIGAPGDDRGGLLTEAVRARPFSVVLLDELEKAHPDILTLFLQVMDDGRLTDGVGRTVDFTNAVLIATSNAGTSFIQEATAAGQPLEQIKTALLERELKGIFRPEFLNRFDATIVFAPLTQDDMEQIAWLMLNALAKRLSEQGIGFRADDEAVSVLAKKGYDPLFGARPLRRVIQDTIENQVADLLLKKAVARRDTIVLQADGTLGVEKG